MAMVVMVDLLVLDGRDALSGYAAKMLDSCLKPARASAVTVTP